MSPGTEASAGAATFERVARRRAMEAHAARIADEAPRSWSEYFSRRIAEGRPTLRPLGKPCHDCAVVCGLYLEVSDALSREPRAVVDAYSAGWFCHNNRDRACRGNLDYQERVGGPSKPSTTDDSRAPGLPSNKDSSHD